MEQIFFVSSIVMLGVFISLSFSLCQPERGGEVGVMKVGGVQRQRGDALATL